MQHYPLKINNLSGFAVTETEDQFDEEALRNKIWDYVYRIGKPQTIDSIVAEVRETEANVRLVVNHSWFTCNGDMVANRIAPCNSALFPMTDEAKFDSRDSNALVEIRETPVGKGVFASAPFPADAIVGEITGVIGDGPDEGGEYSMCIGGGKTLDPAAPFRFLNHSCEPNCEFDYWDAPDDATGEVRLHAFLITLQVVNAGEQLVIDYNWPASNAIRCECGEATCRGWVVAAEELEFVRAEHVPSANGPEK